MRVTSELTLRRLVVALVGLAALPALLAFAAVQYRSPDLPAGPPSYNPLPLPRVPVLAALLNRELQRSRRLTGPVPPPGTPLLVPPKFPEPLPTIVLPRRTAAYDITELRAHLPAAFATVGNALLLKADIEIQAGARLLVDGARTPRLAMLSAPAGFATVVARGALQVQGSAQTPVRIYSWNPATQGVDRASGDGRAFLLALGGRMDLSHADMGYLGFGTGTSSGVAWRGAEHPPGTSGTPAGGDVRDSVLHDNRFGAYTFEAARMRWTGNTFRDNEAYGFDPHDLSDDFVITGNVATGNGRHGFIFSRGCNGNLLRNNVAYDNRGHGFMIDDGRSADGEGFAARPLASNNNVLIGNHAFDNDGSGVEIEGGEGTVVKDNLFERNHVAVRIKNGASVLVANNRLVESRLAGVDVLAGAGKVSIQDNHLTGGWAGVSLSTRGAAVLADNVVEGTSTPLVVAGQPLRQTSALTLVGRVFRWNPLLILWVTILGLPTALTLRRQVRAVGRIRRREPIRSS